MRKTVFLLASLFVMVLATQRVNAQSSATANAQATATIVTPISISKTGGDLAFGKIVPSSTAGTVIVTPVGDISATDGATIFQNNAHSATTFKVSGESGAAYTLTFSADPLEGPTGSANMTVDTFTHNANLTLAGGEETFGVGATLHVDADQAAGEYAGEFTVTVAYN
jgi:hypothetical protein